MKALDFKPKFFSCLKGYNGQQFGQDALAGLITGIVALPLAIAFGIASGVSPVEGITTAIIAGFIISLLGGSKVQIGGPTGAFIVIIYGVIAQYGLGGLMTATILAGIMLILMGVFKLGSVIKFIPYPIIIGFTAGIAVTIFTTQVGDICGFGVKTPGEFIGKWVVYAQNIDKFNVWAFVIALFTLLVIIFSPKAFKKVPGLNKIPGSLYGIIFGTLVYWGIKSFVPECEVETIGSKFGVIKASFSVTTPELSYEAIRAMFPVAFTIAILGAIESLLSAAVADGVIGDRHNSNTELIGQGVANVITPFFGGIPATGAIARTMTNINNGGRTPVAGIVHAIVLLIILLVLMPLAGYIPMACLAGVLVIVSYNMSGWRTFKAMLHNPKSDVSVLLVTFFLTVIFDLTIAIEFGLVLACLLLLRRMASAGHITLQEGEIDANNDSDVQTSHDEALQIPAGVQVYEIDGPFFFGIANKFEELSANMLETPLVRIIRMRKVPFVDATGLHNLEVFIHNSHQQGIHVVLSGVRPEVLAVIRKSTLFGEVGEMNIFNHINGAMDRAKEVVAHPHVHHRHHSR
ncbi:MAG: SulP family inorganic anion transporter [Bacteroidales bacterium]|nr:SulP family inorganic anion transporter [Bacteroidales bacterium]